MVTTGVQGGVSVTAGRWMTGYLGSKIASALPAISTNADLQKAVAELITAGITAVVAGQVLPARWAPFVAAGAFARPIESLAKSAGISIVTEGLSAYPPRLSAYPPRMIAHRGTSAYPPVMGRARMLAGDRAPWPAPASGLTVSHGY
jgi:hypothetical protein